MANDYNQHVFDRLKGCRDGLMSIYASGSAMSGSTTGAEREIKERARFVLGRKVA